jgi:protoporphyrinogen oxidase
MTAPAVVIGAGPAGLSAALSLARAGHKVCVLEASDRVGGLSGSFDFEGFRVDYGPHRMHLAARPEVLALYHEALGETLRVRARDGLVHLGSRRLPYPLSILGLARGLGPWEAALHGWSGIAARLWRPKGRHFAAEAARRLGRRAVRSLYGPAARKVWGVEPEELDEFLARARVQKGSPLEVLRAALGAGTASSTGRRYFYPARGFGALSEAMADLLRRYAGEIHFAARVEGVVRDGGRARAVVAAGREWPADTVVATAPLPALCDWAGRPDAAEGLHYRALVLLYVALRRARATPQDVHYFADERIAPSRMFEAKGFTGGEGPADITAVGFDLPCNPGDPIWSAPADAILERVRPAMEQAGLGDTAILRTEVRRVASAYPLYRKGFAASRARALDAVSEIEGVYPVGRHALFLHDNLHHACAAGLACGRAIASGATSRAWRRQLESFLNAQIED